MQRSGTKTYSDPEQFQESLPDPRGALAFTGPGPFRARQTWITLKHLYLLQVEETLPRIAFISLPSDRIHISFPLDPTFNPVWGGVVVRPGEIVLHGHGRGAHDRTLGPNCWGLISIEKRVFAAYAKQVAGIDIAVSPISQILRPSSSAAMRLISLHRKACRLTAKAPEFFSHSEVARALENELLETLGKCIESGDRCGKLAVRAKMLDAMSDFEAAVRAGIRRPLTVPRICHMIGVAERTLRAHCTDILGMSPNRYLRLRRLNLIRAALHHADPATTIVEAVARHFQFAEPGRFAIAYREAFGESPSVTLRRPRFNKP